ncbi:serine-threonine/tyrosine-protein kinase catalytic domain-containing protein, partial [Tanacetum coccineum]
MSVLKESKHLRLSLKEIELATNNFNEPIGKGGYGMVYKGELSISGKKPTHVAVKTLGEKSWQGLKQFLTEIQLLTGQHHKNIISLLGFCEEGKHKSLVYEYAANGSLDTYLGGDDNWVAKIADLGLSKLNSEIAEASNIVSDPCGTPGYCDPEYMNGILKKEYD